MARPVAKNPRFIFPSSGKTLALRYTGKNGKIFDELRFSPSPKWPEVALKISLRAGKPVVTLDLRMSRMGMDDGLEPPPLKVWIEGLGLYFPEFDKRKLEIPLGAFVARLEQHLGPSAFTREVQEYCAGIFKSYEMDYTLAMKGIKVRLTRHVPIWRRKKLSYPILDLCLLQNWSKLKSQPVTNKQGLAIIGANFEMTARVLINTRRLPRSKKRVLVPRVARILHGLTIDKWCPFDNYLSRRKIKLASREFRKAEGYKAEQAMRLFYKLLFRLARKPEKIDPKDYDRFCRVLSY